MATAKQLAARRKFVEAVRAGKFRRGKKSSTRRKTKRRVSSSPKRRRTITRVITKVRTRTSMARRRRSRSSPRRKGFKIPVISSPLFKQASAGVGAGILLTTILSMIGQGQLAQNPVVKVGAGFATGDIVGAAASLLVGGGLNGILGGGSNGNMEGLA